MLYDRNEILRFHCWSTGKLFSSWNAEGGVIGWLDFSSNINLVLIEEREASEVLVVLRRLNLPFQTD